MFALTCLAFSSSLRFLSSSRCFIFSSFFRALQQHPLQSDSIHKDDRETNKTYFLLRAPSPASAVDEGAGSMDSFDIACVVWSAEPSMEIDFLVHESRRWRRRRRLKMKNESSLGFIFIIIPRDFYAGLVILVFSTLSGLLTNRSGSFVLKVHFHWLLINDSTQSSSSSMRFILFRNINDTLKWISQELVL